MTEVGENSIRVLIVDDIAETRENKTIARIEWQMRGRRRLILAVQEVTQ